MGLGQAFRYCAYVSDNGNSYVVKLAEETATEGGFVEVIDPLALPGWGFGPKNMRHVWGVDSDGNRTKLPIAANDNAKYVSGGLFSLQGRSYLIQGAIGERRALSALGG